MPNLMTTESPFSTANPGTRPDEGDDEVVQPKGAEFKIFTGALKAFERDDGHKYLRCTASSTAKDLHGDEMTTDCVMGMAPQAKSKGMTIFLNHSYKMPEDVFGKVVDAKVISRAQDDVGNPIYDLDLEIQLDGSNERATKTYESIVDSGIKAGVSIGALIEDYEFIDEEAGWWGGLRIKQVVLLEASIVGIPANQRSWVINALAALGAPKAIINKALGRGEPAVAKITEPTIKIVELKDGDLKAAQFQYFLPDGTEVTNSITVKEIELDPATMSPIIKDTTPLLEVEDSAAPPEEIQTESDKSADADDPADDEETAGAAPVAEVEAAVANLKAAGVSGELLDVVLGLFEGATEEVVSLRKALEDVTVERDQARQEILTAAEIVETLARTPLGRKAHFVGPVSTFRARYGGYYDEGFLKLLEERNTE